jgi:hypothetical protein
VPNIGRETKNQNQNREESKSKLSLVFKLMNAESTPIKTKPLPLPPPPLPSIKKKTPSPLSPIWYLVMSLVPKRGGTHPIYGVFLGGGSVGAGWDMDTARYRFSSQRRDKKIVGKVERGLTDARDKTATIHWS